MTRSWLRSTCGSALLLAALGAGCHGDLRPVAAGESPAGRDAHAEHTAHAEHGHTAHAGHGQAGALPGSSPLPERSIYQLEGSWTDARGSELRLEELRGEPVLALLFYGTCQHACPILVHDIQRIEAALEPSERERTRVLLVTFDPERDTPARLAAFARDKGLDPERWFLLHGSPEQIRELALVLGIRYRPSGDGGFGHTMRITLLDADGLVVEQVDGLRQDSEPLVEAVRTLLGEGAA